MYIRVRVGLTLEREQIRKPSPKTIKIIFSMAIILGSIGSLIGLFLGATIGIPPLIGALIGLGSGPAVVISPVIIGSEFFASSKFIRLTQSTKRAVEKHQINKQDEPRAIQKTHFKKENPLKDIYSRQTVHQYQLLSTTEESKEIDLSNFIPRDVNLAESNIENSEKINLVTFRKSTTRSCEK